MLILANPLCLFALVGCFDFSSGNEKDPESHPEGHFCLSVSLKLYFALYLLSFCYPFHVLGINYARGVPVMVKLINFHLFQCIMQFYLA